MKRFKLPITSVLSLVLLASCVSLQQPLLTNDWVYADLRSLDPADSPLPGQDLIAVYTRINGEELQVRLDFLDLALIPDFDLYLALDTMPGGKQDLPLQSTADLEWDILAIIPASGNIRVIDSDNRNFSGVGLLTLRDYLADTMILSLNRKILSIPGYLSAGNPDYRLQVFLTPAGSSIVLDQTASISTVSLPPPPAKVLFVFWNTYPAYSPVTALRRWNGAHTGPLGGNHGLLHLLRAAQNFSIPLVLLDLKTPSSLSALDFSGNLGLVKEMVSQDSLILPDYLPDLLPVQYSQSGSFADQVFTANREISGRFGLPDSPFASAPQSVLPIQPGIQVIFSRVYPEDAQASSLKPVNMFRWRDRKIIPIQIDYDLSMQATLEGPAPDVRQSMIETALASSQASSPSDIPILVLGGDLTNSTWGVAPMARATFNYLRGHPWIQILSAYDLLSYAPERDGEEIKKIDLSSSMSNFAKDQFYSPYQPAISTSLNAELIQSIERCDQNNTGRNSLCEAARQTYLSLFNLVNNPSEKLPDLRLNYVGQVWSLLEAAQWSAAPYTQSTCNIDPDRDGQPECILSSEDFYTQFEIDSGSLSYAFCRHPGDSQGKEIHQFVGPSSQFITGLSDPGQWDLRGGLSADPSVIVGAFVENEMNYQVSMEADKLVFSSAKGQVIKTYQLNTNGIHVEYSISPGILLPNPRIPLVLDPWQRFFPGWAKLYHPIDIPNSWIWQFQNGLKVQIRTNASFTASTFKDSLPSLLTPEDPNHDYPPGHFLPFPIVLIEINLQGKYSFYVDIIPSF